MVATATGHFPDIRYSPKKCDKLGSPTIFSGVKSIDKCLKLPFLILADTLWFRCSIWHKQTRVSVGLHTAPNQSVRVPNSSYMPRTQPPSCGFNTPHSQCSGAHYNSFPWSNSSIVFFICLVQNDGTLST